MDKEELEAQNKRYKEALEDVLKYSQIFILETEGGISCPEVNMINSTANRALNGIKDDE